ncbi:MAG TPA: flavin reductase family protein [Acidimicrobiales bacterium]|nr:flavin reductase family protein [Acidimicrobiales bacterium]
MDEHPGDDAHGPARGPRAAQATVASSALVGRLDYPMFVVTTMAGTTPSGCLAGFVTQCSIMPARFLVCVSKKNHTAGVAARSDALGVHLLGRDQLDLASVFGELTGDRDDKFALVHWRRGTTGVPVLEECAAWVEGPVVGRIDLGDHAGHVVEPVAGGGGGAAGELSYSSTRHLVAGHPPTD